jgi:Na+-transporting methylmalonyl-CoA/oxaloacetate decarboxylase gamma subunit
MNDDNFAVFVFLPLGLCVVVFIMGALAGQGMGENKATRETIVYCVEKPADCKVKYDYYKLEIKND